MNNITQLIFTTRKNSFKKIITACSFLLISCLSFGQINMSTSGNHAQDFNTLSSTTAATPPWANNSTIANWYSQRTGTGTTYSVDTGSSNGGNLYSYGSTSSSDRSLGSLGSSNAAAGNFAHGVLLRNTSGSILNDLKVSYTLEQWRNSATTAHSITFWYRTSSSTITSLNPNSNAGWTQVTALTTDSPITGGTASALNGNLTVNKVTLTSISIPSLSLANNDYIMLKWEDPDNTGSDHGLGIDDVTLSWTFPPAAITSQASGNWSDTATWVGGVIPTSADNAIIAAGHVVIMDNATYATRNSGTTTTVNVGGTLATSQTYINNGTTTINGAFQLNSGGWVSDAGGTASLVYGSNGTLIFNTAYTANNGNYWPTINGPVNVTVNSGSNLTLGFNRTVSGTFQTAATVTLGASVLTLNGINQLNSGAFFSSAPTYGSASTLVYNTSYGISNEWIGNGAAGVGIPANVRVQSGTLTLTNSDRGIPGNITIDATCSLVLNTSSGDLYIGGNWNNSGTFTPNGRAVFFNGTTTQTITNASGETFNYLINNKSAGSLTLANNVTVNATAGNTLQIVNSGSINLNGFTLTLSNNGGDILVNGGVRTITSSVAGGILSITGTKTVTSTASGTLTLGTNVTTSLTNGIDFGSSLTTIQGKLQVNTGGYVISNAPIYSNASTLEYNNVAGYGVNNEWNGNATTASSGTPQNVVVTNSSITLPNSVRSLAGNLTIGATSTLNLNATLASDLNIGGNWINSGTFNANNRQVIFRGSVAQTLTGATTFDYLKIDNTAGLTLNNSISNNFTLDLSAGNITLGTNDLTIGSAGTVINSSATSYVNTNGTGQLERTVGATNILFPIGRSAYNPITFNNSGTSDVYGVRVTDAVLTSALTPTKTVTRRWITTEAVVGGSNLAVVAQYNNGEPNTAFAAATTPFIGFYNGSSWSQVGATLAGSNPFTFTSSFNSTPADLSTGTQYFALGKDNAFLSVASQLAITIINPATPGAGYGFNVSVQAQDAFGSPSNVVANTSFTFTTNGAAGVIGGNITGTILAGTNTIVVSGVTLATAGTGVTLTATQTSGDALNFGTSANFNVLAAASQLAFVGVPATGNVGVNLTSFTVEARRPDNSIDTFYNSNIIISKATGTGNLSGTLTTAAVNGVATFSLAQFDAASTYSLNANSGALLQATSGNIVVSLAPVVIAAWDFFGVTSASPPATFVATTFNTNLDNTSALNTITRGVGANASGANNSFRTAGFQNNGISTANTDYFQTTLKTDVGYELSLSNLNAIYSGTTSFYATPGVTSQYAYSLDGATFTLIGSPVTSTSVLSPISVNLSSIPELQNVPSNTTIYIRYYASGQTTTGGWGYISSASGTNGLAFSGNVICSIPAAFNVTGGSSICVGSEGTLVGLDNSQIGIDYQLKVDGSNIGSPLAGTGSAISFGNQNTIGTYTVEAINDNNTCNEVVTMTGSAVITAGATTTWSGSPTPSWDNGLPTSEMTAIISADYSEAATIDACSLTVDNNAVVVIPSGFNVNLNGALTVNSGSFTLNNNANLVQTSNALNSGNISVKRSTNPLMRFDYMAWSSPVLNQGLLSFSPLTSISPTVRFYTFTSSSNLYTSVGSPAINTATFDSGKGYLIRLPFNHPTAPIVWTGTFTGQPFNGPWSIALGNDVSDATKRYNLVGNPYPSTINISAFASANTANIEPTLYFWRKTNNASSPSYCTYNTVSQLFGDNGEAYTESPNGVIQVGQGFIVQAKPSATQVVFDNNQRIANNDNQVFRSSEALATASTVENNNFWLNMTGATTEFSQAVIGYHSNATQGVDDYDSKYFNDGAIAFTSLVDSQDYTIQGRALPFNVSDVVPMKYKVTTAGNYSIMIDHVDGMFTDGAQAIYVRDNVTNTYHNLFSGAYTFTSAAGTFTNRFDIVYQSALNVDTVDFTSNNVLVYNSNNVLIINTGIHSMSSVKVFDIRGRLIGQKSEINASETQLNVGTTNQVLIVQITSSEGIIVSKKVMN